MGFFNLFVIKRVLSFHTCRMWPLLCLSASFAVPLSRPRSPEYTISCVDSWLPPAHPSGAGLAFLLDVASPGLCREAGSPPSACCWHFASCSPGCSLLSLPRAQVGGSCSPWSTSQTLQLLFCQAALVVPACTGAWVFPPQVQDSALPLPEFLTDKKVKRMAHKQYKELFSLFKKCLGLVCALFFSPSTSSLSDPVNFW